VRDGYCIAWGIGSGRLIQELARQSNLQILVLDPDEKKVQGLRNQRLADDSRASRLHGDPATFRLPPYLARLDRVARSGPALAWRPEISWPGSIRAPPLRRHGLLFPTKATSDIADQVTELSLAKAKSAKKKA